jgi:beta-phosphoglucomutase-like phosphatase (HAD superfamily)
LAKVGVHVDFPYVQQHFLGRSWSKVAAEVRYNYGLSLDSGFEESYRNELLQAFEGELQNHRRRGDRASGNIGVAFCVATSSSPKRAQKSLAMSGLAPFFGDRLYTASQVENGKPAPDLFLHAARSMGFEPRNCLVIEDSIPGIAAARAAGMHIWWFTGGSHLRPRRPELDKAVGKVPIFDNWRQFFEMAPELKSGGSVAEDLNG